MFITIPHGDIFTTQAQALAIPVNCKGIAGAGLAKNCRIKHPTWFSEYKRQCVTKSEWFTKKTIYPTHPMTIFKDVQPWIINFPTKIDWRLPSKYEYILADLSQLEALLERESLTSVALPKLGCGLGGLPWKTHNGNKGVSELIRTHFEQSSCTFYLYE